MHQEELCNLYQTIKQGLKKQQLVNKILCIGFYTISLLPMFGLALCSWTGILQSFMTKLLLLIPSGTLGVKGCHFFTDFYSFNDQILAEKNNFIDQIFKFASEELKEEKIGKKESNELTKLVCNLMYMIQIASNDVFFEIEEELKKMMDIFKNSSSHLNKECEALKKEWKEENRNKIENALTNIDKNALNPKDRLIENLKKYGLGFNQITIFLKNHSEQDYSIINILLETKILDAGVLYRNFSKENPVCLIDEATKEFYNFEIQLAKTEQEKQALEREYYSILLERFIIRTYKEETLVLKKKKEEKNKTE